MFHVPACRQAGNIVTINYYFCKIHVKKAFLQINDIRFEVELYETETAEAVYKQLPFSGMAQRWGQEIYFDVPFPGIALEPDARDVMEIGEIGYWVSGSAIAIFFGSTPASKDNEPRSVEPINVFGKIIGDPTALESVREGELVFMIQEEV